MFATKEYLLRQYDETGDSDGWEVHETVFVHNTFTQTWEMEPYFEIAGKTDTLVHTIVVENRHGNNSVHDVPDGTMSRMRQRFDVSL